MGSYDLLSNRLVSSRRHIAITVCLAAMSIVSSAWSVEPPVDPGKPDVTPTPHGTPTGTAAVGASDDRALLREREIILNRFEILLKKGVGPPPNESVPKPALPPRTTRRPIIRPQVNAKRQYTGYIDRSAVNVSITMHGRTVEGDLYFLRSPARLYTITGSKMREGRLRLTLADESIAIGVVTLETTKDSSVDQWKGKMRDKEGRAYEFFLYRDLKSKRTSSRPQTIAEFESLSGFQSYRGTVKDLTVKDRKMSTADAFFKLKSIGLKWRGFYYQRYANGKTSKILELEGEQIRPEELTLRERDDDGLSAKFELEKVPLEFSPTRVKWTGKLKNIRDNNKIKDVEFSRKR